MFNRNIKKLGVSSIAILLTLFATVACSEKTDDKKVAEKPAEVAKTEVAKVEREEIKVSDDIMMMLAGTDPCFEAVEIVRNDGDLADYRDFGDSILLEDDYVERPGHKTYIGTVAKMLKEDRNIQEIRQVLLNKCRAFGVANEKAKEEAKAREALQKQSTEKKDLEKKESN